MAANVAISPLPYLQFNTNGIPLAGGKLFCYQTGSTTKQATYTDSTGATPNPNPVILDSNGQADVWLVVGEIYKFVLAPSTDTDPPTNPIWTQDGMFGVPATPNIFGTANTWTARQKVVIGTGYTDDGLAALRVESHTDVMSGGTNFSVGASLSGWGTSSNGQVVGSYNFGFGLGLNSNVFGSNSMAVSGTPLAAPTGNITLVGQEIDVVSQYHANTADIVGQTIVFLDRMGGAVNVLYGSVGSNMFNYNSVGLRFDSIPPSAGSGENCSWNTGIAFSSGAIGIAWNGSTIVYGTALDFTNINAYGGGASANCIKFPDGTIQNSAPFGVGFKWKHYGTGTSPARVVNAGSTTGLYGPYSYPIQVEITCESIGGASVNDTCQLCISDIDQQVANPSTFATEYNQWVVDIGVTSGQDATAPAYYILPQGYILKAIVPAGSYYWVNVFGTYCAQAAGTNSWRELQLGTYNS